MLKCATCGKFISSNAAASCGVCPLVYHKACVMLSDTAPVSREWACPECKKKVPKGDNIPDRGSSAGQVQDGGPSMQSGASRASTAHTAGLPTATSPALTMPPANEMQDLRKELAECLAEMREFRRDMAEFRLSVAGISARMDVFEQRMEVVEQRCAEPAAARIAELENTVCQLRMELNDRDQEAFLSDLEIGNLPEERGESVLHTVTVLASKLGVPLEERDVVFAERVGAAQLAVAAGDTPRPRRVVVRVARRHLRDDLLQAARVRRSLTAVDAGRSAAAPEPISRIFLNERLTRANRHLFYRVREECRRLQWRYSWTKKGRVYARQGDGMPVYPIRSEPDVERIFGPRPV